MSFNIPEFLSREIKTSSFLFYSRPLISPICKVIIRHFLAVFLFDFRTDMIYDLLSNMTLTQCLPPCSL